MIEYKIFAPSYKRAKIARTHKYLPQITYVVMESEAEEYRKIHDKVWSIPDKVQGNLPRVYNYILDNSNIENTIITDDDIKFFGRFNGNIHKKLDADEVDQMILEGIILATDLDVRYWGLNCLMDKGAYREYTPFGTRQYIGGPFQGHRNNELRYDESLSLKEDYDMTIQVLNKYRKNLRLNMYHYSCDQNTSTGGCATYRNVELEEERNKLLQDKWGSHIVRFDRSNKSGKGKKYDINPIINVPIGGV